MEVLLPIYYYLHQHSVLKQNVQVHVPMHFGSRFWAFKPLCYITEDMGASLLIVYQDHMLVYNKNIIRNGI